MNNSSRDVVLFFEANVATLDSVQRAALKFTALCAFAFESVSTGTKVTLSFPFQVEVNQDELVGRFRNEVLDQSLRSRIADETSQERNLILAYAFSNTKLIGQ